MPDAVRHPLFARFYAWLAPIEDRAGVAAHRRDLVAGLRGRVLELGVGTGLSFRHYPAEVEQLLAVEPEPTMRANAAKAAREVVLDVQVVEGTADALPAPDASVDAAVISQVLCSVPDPARAGRAAARPAPGRRAALLRARAVAQRARPAPLPHRGHPRGPAHPRRGDRAWLAVHESAERHWTSSRSGPRS